MSIGWQDSYLGQLRSIVGHRLLMAPGVRAVMRDREGRILWVRRADNGTWVMPAGSLEPGESVRECLTREVREETGLQVNHAVLFAIYTGPRFEYTNMYGDHNKMLAFAFLVENWSGDLMTGTDETIDARFFYHHEVPEMPALYRETIADLAHYLNESQVILK